MPQTRRERMFFAALTVLITVHAYLIYSIFVVNGDSLVEYASLLVTEPVPSVAQAIDILGGITVFGQTVPVWGVVVIEFCFAYSLEMIMGSPCSMRLVLKSFAPAKTAPALLETAIICATVGLMCPAMSLVAAFLYFPYGTEAFTPPALLINWAELVCLNFPFAFFSQLFYIQPLVRVIFRACFRHQKKAPNRPGAVRETS